MEDADAVTQRLLGLSRQKLQAEAKKMGVKANRKSMDIIKDIVSATSK